MAHRRRWLAFFAAVLLCSPFLAAQGAAKVALVVGNSAYKNASPLKNPVNDAIDMEKSLRSIGFAVTSVRDGTKEGMLQAIDAFGRAMNRADVALFFYAGHGVQSGGENYLIPVDADIPTESHLASRAVGLGEVTAWMEQAAPSLRIVILDACRDNPFKATRSGSRGLSVVPAPRGSVIVYSTSPGNVAQDGDGRNGIFTESLLKFIATPNTDFRRMLDLVGRDVDQKTGGKQIPWVNTSFFGDYALVGDLGSAPSPAAKTSLPAAQPPLPAAKEETLPALVTLRCFNQEVGSILNSYMASGLYDPGKAKIEYTIDQGEDYLKSLDAALRGEGPAPDLFALESKDIRRYVESGLLADLSALAPVAADAYPYVREAATDGAGKLRALSWQACPGAFIYRRSVAVKYLGTADPQAIRGMLADKASFLATAETLRAKSAGKALIVPSLGDLVQVFKAKRSSPWLKGGRLVIDPATLDLLDLARTFSSKGYAGKEGQWSQAWFEGMSGTMKDARGAPLEVFGYALPTWGLEYVIKQNSKSKDGSIDSAGDWAMVPGPWPYAWGGTWIAARAGAGPAALALLKDLCADKAILESWVDTTGSFVSDAKIIEARKAASSDPFLGGQSSLAVFAENASRVSAKNSGPYDVELDALWLEQVVQYANGGKTKDRALADFKAAVKKGYPGIAVQ
jgi:hypothetical protein